jgi:hypothetical protein
MIGGERGEGYAAEVGKALHEGLQDYWITGDKDSANYAMMMKYPYHLEREYDTYGDRSLEACYATLEMMIGANALRNREIATIECLDGVNRPAVEVPFEINFPDLTVGGLPVSYIGFIDAILFNRADGMYEVTDIKTTRDTALSNPAIKYKFDTQCLPYGFVLQRVLGKTLDAGFNVNYFHVYVDIQTPSAMLYPMPKSARHMQDWLQTFLYEIRDINDYVTSGWWPRNEDACIVYRKNKCGFYDLCDSRNHAAIQDMLLNGTDPVEVLKKQRPFEPWIAFDLRVQ